MIKTLLHAWWTAILGLSIQAQVSETPALRFATNPVVVRENAGVARIEILRQGDPAPAVSVTFVAWAAEPERVLPVTNRVEFAPNETQRWVEVVLIDDAENRAAEFVELYLRESSANARLGSSVAAFLVIEDDDLPTVGLVEEPKSVWETNGVVQVLVARGGTLSAEARVRLTGRPVSVFEAPRLFVGFTNDLIFAPGERQVTVPVTLVRDYQAAGDQSLRLTLSGSDTGPALSPSNHTIVIQDLESEMTMSVPSMVRENQGPVVVRVTRQGNVTGAASIDLTTQEDSARAGRDFTALGVRLDFAPGESSKAVELGVIDNGQADPPRRLWIQISGAIGARWAAEPTRSVVILDDESDALPGGTLPGTELMAFDNSVYSLERLEDGRWLVGGSFKAYGGAQIEQVAILTPGLALDPKFNPREAGGLGGRVERALPLSGGRVLILGSFSRFQGEPRQGLARLLPDGRLDPEFRMDIDRTASVVGRRLGGGYWIGGALSQVNGEPSPGVITVQADGSRGPDLAGLEVGSAINSASLCADAEGNLVVGGWNGTEYRARRWRADGTLDPEFGIQDVRLPFGGFLRLPDGRYLTSAGYRLLPNGIQDVSLPIDTARVNETLMTQWPDGRVLVSFWNPLGFYELRRRFADGTLDDSFRAVADGSIQTAVFDPDGSVWVGGTFRNLNGLPRGRLGRLRGDASGPTRVRWHGERFGVEERGGTLRLPILRTGDLGSESTVQVTVVAGTAAPGEDFVPGLGVVRFAPGERVQWAEFTPVRDALDEPDETVELQLTGEGIDPEGQRATVVLFDEGSRIRWRASSWEFWEGGRPVKIWAERSGGLAYAVNATVQWIVPLPSGGFVPVSTTDYRIPDSSVLKFAPGQSETELEIVAQDDAESELTETLLARLVDPASGVLGERVTVDGNPDLVLSLRDNDDGLRVGETVSMRTTLHPRDGGGLWISTGPPGTFPPVLGPAALRPDGSVDDTFMSRPGQGLLLDLFPDGDLLVQASESDGAGRLIRLNPNGQEDASFTPVSLPRETTSGPIQWDVTTTPDGGLATAHTEFRSVASRTIRVRRYSAEGVPIAGFVSHPLTVFAPFVPSQWPVSISIAAQRSGKLVVAGDVGLPWPNPNGSIRVPPGRYHVVRLLADGSGDFEFLTEFGTMSVNPVSGLRVLPDDRILVTGRFTWVNGVARPGIVRLLPDGATDPTFTPQNPWPDGSLPQWAATAPLAEGGLWVARRSGAEWRVARLGDDGRDLTPAGFPVFNGEVWSIAPLADGRLVVTGAFDRVGPEFRGGIAWLDASGALLPSHPLELEPVPAGATGVGRLRVGVRGPGSLRIQESTDLRRWVDLWVGEMSPGMTELELPPGAPGTDRFFRGVR